MLRPRRSVFPFLVQGALSRFPFSSLVHCCENLFPRPFYMEVAGDSCVLKQTLAERLPPDTVPENLSVVFSLPHLTCVAVFSPPLLHSSVPAAVFFSLRAKVTERGVAFSSFSHYERTPPVKVVSGPPFFQRLDFSPLSRGEMQVRASLVGFPSSGRREPDSFVVCSSSPPPPHLLPLNSPLLSEHPFDANPHRAAYNCF